MEINLAITISDGSCADEIHKALRDAASAVLRRCTSTACLKSIKNIRLALSTSSPQPFSERNKKMKTFYMKPIPYFVNLAMRQLEDYYRSADYLAQQAAIKARATLDAQQEAAKGE